MKKLVSLMLILCMVCMLNPAMADSGAAGVWYADYYGAVMILTLNDDGTSSMTVSGNQMGVGTWVENDGKIEITMTDMTGEASTQVATLSDGVLTLADGNMSVNFSQEPIESWMPAAVRMLIRFSFFALRSWKGCSHNAVTVSNTATMTIKIVAYKKIYRLLLMSFFIGR